MRRLRPGLIVIWAGIGASTGPVQHSMYVGASDHEADKWPAVRLMTIRVRVLCATFFFKLGIIYLFVQTV
jgi:hypothetical protein